jgi:hypothetical protein
MGVQWGKLIKQKMEVDNICQSHFSCHLPQTRFLSQNEQPLSAVIGLGDCLPTGGGDHFCQCRPKASSISRRMALSAERLLLVYLLAEYCTRVTVSHSGKSTHSPLAARIRPISHVFHTGQLVTSQAIGLDLRRRECYARNATHTSERGVRSRHFRVRRENGKSRCVLSSSLIRRRMG